MGKIHNITELKKINETKLHKLNTFRRTNLFIKIINKPNFNENYSFVTLKKDIRNFKKYDKHNNINIGRIIKIYNDCANYEIYKSEPLINWHETVYEIVFPKGIEYFNKSEIDEYNFDNNSKYINQLLKIGYISNEKIKFGFRLNDKVKIISEFINYEKILDNLLPTIKNYGNKYKVH